MQQPMLSGTSRKACLIAALAIPSWWGSALAATLPEIRVSAAAQQVPACVTPDRLMRHVRERTSDLDRRFHNIAHYYKSHGEASHIRWDYAFFQMLLETNYLSYRRANGEWGDVRPHQNNFAGIGATGGGVPGDSFPDVSTGVLAQMQHLLAYSGERVERPVATRTREKQDDIISKSLSLRRPVRFSDLTNRWAADRNYARSIESVAERYRQAFCAPTGQPLDGTTAEANGDDRKQRPLVASAAERAGAAALPKAPAPSGPACDVWSASYGGPVAVLIRSVSGSTVNYTVLQVEAVREQPQTDAFIRMHTPNGSAIARFGSRDAAFARAFELCPGPS